MQCNPCQTKTIPEQSPTAGISCSTTTIFLKWAAAAKTYIPDSYLAIDDIEMGWKNRIPMWMFGLMY